MATQYNPESAASRKALAAAILNTLLKAGFTEVQGGSATERVFTRQVQGTAARVLVYTTVVPTEKGKAGEVRGIGEDAIRVAAVTHLNGSDRGLVKTRKVLRTGEVGAIAERMLGRMREAYKLAHGRSNSPAPRCHCGAEKFLSKKGNMVCSDFCWSK